MTAVQRIDVGEFGKKKNLFIKTISIAAILKTHARARA